MIFPVLFLTLRYGIDSNVLIRYLTQDDPEQSQKATQCLEQNCTVDNPGHVAHIVLCEVVWILKKAYGYSKAEILKALQLILSTAEFSIESPSIAWEALRQYSVGSADFSDYLIGHLSRFYGCVTTVTFDREAGKSNNFQLL